MPPSPTRLQWTRTPTAQWSPRLTLDVSRDGASTTSLGNLCQCLTTLIIKYSVYPIYTSFLLVWNHFLSLSFPPEYSAPIPAPRTLLLPMKKEISLTFAVFPSSLPVGLVGWHLCVPNLTCWRWNGQRGTVGVWKFRSEGEFWLWLTSGLSH